MAITTVTTKSFQEILDKNDTVVIDFWAEWCGPCKSFGPTFEAVAEGREDIVFGKCDVDMETEIAEQLKVMAIPTVVVFNKGKVVARKSGRMSKDILNSILPSEE